jgi:Tol biopolymer transport system component
VSRLAGEPVRSRWRSGVLVTLLLLALAVASASGGATGPPKCNSRSAPHKAGCLNVLTSGGNVGPLLWADADTLFLQNDNYLQRVAVSTRTFTTLDGPGVEIGFRALSPDHSKIVYTTFYPDGSVRTLPLTGGTPFVVTSAPASTTLPKFPIWRADGQRLAYVNDYVGGEVDWVPASGGSPTVVMAAGSYVRTVLAYLADGSIIVGQSDRAQQPNPVLVRVTEGGVQTVLATDAYAPVASPDGSTVAYQTSAGDVYAISTAGGTPVPLGVNVSTYSEMAFSPDGSLLAVGGYDPTYTTVSAWVAHVDGSGATKLPFGGFNFGWSPDQSKITMYGFEPGTTNPALAVVNADGSNLKELFSGICSSPLFSTDASKIACIDYVVDPITGIGYNELGVVSLR